MDLNETTEMLIAEVNKLFNIKKIKTIKNVLKKYNEPNRFYHNTIHLSYMLKLIKKHKRKNSNFICLFLALIYHDIIYNPASNTNEEDSNNYWLNDSPVFALSDSDIKFISNLILSTKEHKPFGDAYDEKLFLDIDLAVLSDERLVYVEYLNDVRREYYHIDEETYCKKRSEVLNEFLKKEKLFLTDYFFQNKEMNARENLKAEINLLKNPRFLKGSFSKTASGLLTFEIFNALPNIIEELLKDLKSKFKIIYSDNSNIFTVNNYKFNSNWDIWAGFYIDSQSSDGDSLLYEIGNFINTILNENRFNKYKQYW